MPGVWWPSHNGLLLLPVQLYKPMNESWKFNAEPATEADCRKYAQQGTRLLATSENWNQILEVVVSKVSPGGVAYIHASGPFGMGTGVWMMPEDLLVIELLPAAAPQQPTEVTFCPP